MEKKKLPQEIRAKKHEILWKLSFFVRKVLESGINRRFL